MTNREYLTEYVTAFTAAVTQQGIREVVISPGSRSTPLAYACMQEEQLTVYRQIDERSAAYFALGLAKATDRPVMLLCTSGTAAVNYFPAIVEAFYARVPLLVVTADRPHELREVGAPQAINQIELYGKHVKWSTDLPLPETDNRLGFLVRHLTRAIGTAITAPAGPVHVNVPLREPLLIDFESKTEDISAVSRFAAESALSEPARLFLNEVFQEERGLLVLGEQTGELPEVFWDFIRKLQWPVLADPLSNARSKVPVDCQRLIVDAYDALLKSNEFKEKIKPEAVIRVGPQPVSKPLLLWLNAVRPAWYIAIDESPMLRDPQSIVTHHIQTASSALWGLPLKKRKETDYASRWQKATEIYWETAAQHAEEVTDEGTLAYTFFEELSDCDVVIGSSMPIRDADTFFEKSGRDVRLYANRGTNGIDGVVSTAFGVQAANKRPAYLLIGDLSFLHDMNGLIASKLQATDLTIVIMNNNGGGIFSYLPQGREERYYEELFGTPTDVTFRDAASMYGADYAEVRSKEELKAALRNGKQASVKLIEVFTDRAQNTAAHRKLWSRVNERLSAE
ncbi:2-succinyl-5-enolpyruvyl-6-hydroxy-3-cyclohexene-1-carboxylic-acid synthase [Planococcus lenghuensis]|uniref:2-succinyl-5-enolpyruvyl-6-hydroxy-3-cyclohexene-1-carboxylate synthase n=1 Tax=Planococcus lenghuensis TaxID=2213202 RepID=A0A1Q2KX22_9BACL|nr:2-succinyl-5-enolpyruvyl-6-hydroxy-3-cyclohexene-1-carboxylic-acid synthase [Planococcus lenghuensis]AQQ52741.1 2-succinyl-5-enolpyruvyl-6-hydroxy-3-cyclohexene-1-carboxylic-acid synthase [Planococcus lenghuensis]